MITIEDFEKAIECCARCFSECSECPFGPDCSIDEVLGDAYALATRLTLEKKAARRVADKALAERDKALAALDYPAKDGEPDVDQETRMAMLSRDLFQAGGEIKLLREDAARAKEKEKDLIDEAYRLAVKLQTARTALAMSDAGIEIERLVKEKEELINANHHLQESIQLLKEQLAVRAEPDPVEWKKSGGSFRCSGCGFMPEFKNIREMRFCPHCGHPAAAYEAAMPAEGTISAG